MQPGGSLSCLQESVNVLHYEPDESSPQLHTVFL